MGRRFAAGIELLGNAEPQLEELWRAELGLYPSPPPHQRGNGAWQTAAVVATGTGRHGARPDAATILNEGTWRPTDAFRTRLMEDDEHMLAFEAVRKRSFRLAQSRGTHRGAITAGGRIMTNPWNENGVSSFPPKAPMVGQEQVHRHLETAIKNFQPNEGSSAWFCVLTSTWGSGKTRTADEIVGQVTESDSKGWIDELGRRYRRSCN